MWGPSCGSSSGSCSCCGYQARAQFRSTEIGMGPMKAATGRASKSEHAKSAEWKNWKKFRIANVALHLRCLRARETRCRIWKAHIESQLNDWQHEWREADKALSALEVPDAKTPCDMQQRERMLDRMRKRLRECEDRIAFLSAGCQEADGWITEILAVRSQVSVPLRDHHGDLLEVMDEPFLPSQTAEECKIGRDLSSSPAASDAAQYVDTLGS